MQPVVERLRPQAVLARDWQVVVAEPAGALDQALLAPALGTKPPGRMVAADHLEPRGATGLEIVEAVLVAWKDQAARRDAEPFGGPARRQQIGAECRLALAVLGFARLQTVVVREGVGADLLSRTVADLLDQGETVVIGILALVRPDLADQRIGRQRGIGIARSRLRQILHEVGLAVEEQQADRRPGAVHAIALEQLQHARDRVSGAEEVAAHRRRAASGRGRPSESSKSSEIVKVPVALAMSLDRVDRCDHALATSIALTVHKRWSAYHSG